MWFYIALATSLISAVTVIFDKKALKGVSPSVLTWCTLLLATPIIAFFATREGAPSINTLFIVGVAGSVLFYTISSIARFRTMKDADLSAIYPLIALGPILTLLIAFLPPLNEKPNFISIIGVLITLFGTYILNISKAKEGLLKPIKLLVESKASALMLFSVLGEGIVVIFDKLAINNTSPNNPTFVLLIENILVIISLLPILYFKNRNFARQIFNNKKLFIIIGALNACSTILAFSAIGGGNVGVVSAVFKLQMLFVLLFSFIFFKDKPRTETIIGSIIMILGVVLIKIGI